MPTSSPWGRAVALSLAMVTTGPCAARATMNVLIVLVDTLRADHMSLYGYARSTTPTLERLASSAVVFEQARSQATCTFPSVNSLLTSRPPSEFLGRFFDMSIPQGTPSFATILAANGHATFAVFGSPVVRATPGRLNNRGGFGEGFERVDESCEMREARCVATRALAMVDESREPFAGYVHFMDPHGPYLPPEDWPRRFATHLPDVLWIREGNPRPFETRVTSGRPIPYPPSYMQGLTDLYDEEIAYFDAELGAFFDGLRRRGVLDRTIVFLVADHGEMFLEHGDVKHCRQVYDSVARTPFIVWPPGMRVGHRVASPVENVDVLPTILDVLGGDAGGAEFAGSSVRDLLERPRGRKRTAHSTQGQWHGVTDGRFKLVRDEAARTERVYDLLVDPGERVDRAAIHPDVHERLRADLDEWLAANDADPTSTGRVRRGKEVHERLRALGYID